MCQRDCFERNLRGEGWGFYTSLSCVQFNGSYILALRYLSLPCGLHVQVPWHFLGLRFYPPFMGSLEVSLVTRFRGATFLNKLGFYPTVKQILSTAASCCFHFSFSVVMFAVTCCFISSEFYLHLCLGFSIFHSHVSGVLPPCRPLINVFPRS